MRPVDPFRQYSLARGGAERALYDVRADLARINEQLATNRRVSRPSDDPGAFGQIRALESLQQRHDAYARAAQSARLWTDRTQQELDHLGGLFQTAHEDALRHLNATSAPTDRAAAADRIDALRREALDALNARVGDEYLFAGTNTTTRPFAADGTPTGNLAGAITRRIGPDTDLQVNVSGVALLDTGAGFSILEALDGLAAALRADDPEALAEAAARVATARDHVFARTSEAGAAGQRLTLAEERIADTQLLLATRRSELEDADVVELTLSFQQRQLSLEAALRATSALTQRSLLDYLR